MASKRPKNWVPNKDIQKKIDETLKDPKRKFSKKAIEKLQREDKEKTTSGSQKGESQATDEPAAFTTTSSVYSASEPSSQYALAKSFILDSLYRSLCHN